jgi:hypothetical protein
LLSRSHWPKSQIFIKVVVFEGQFPATGEKGFNLVDPHVNIARTVPTSRCGEDGLTLSIAAYSRIENVLTTPQLEICAVFNGYISPTERDATTCLQFLGAASDENG